MFCTKCGTPLQEGAKFCVACGTAVAAVSAPPAQMTQIPGDGVTAAPSAAAEAQQQAPVKPEYSAPLQQAYQLLMRLTALGTRKLGIVSIAGIVLFSLGTLCYSWWIPFGFIGRPVILILAFLMSGFALAHGFLVMRQGKMQNSAVFRGTGIAGMALSPVMMVMLANAHKYYGVLGFGRAIVLMYALALSIAAVMQVQAWKPAKTASGTWRKVLLLNILGLNFVSRFITGHILTGIYVLLHEITAVAAYIYFGFGIGCIPFMGFWAVYIVDLVTICAKKWKTDEGVYLIPDKTVSRPQTAIAGSIAAAAIIIVLAAGGRGASARQTAQMAQSVPDVPQVVWDTQWEGYKDFESYQLAADGEVIIPEWIWQLIMSASELSSSSWEIQLVLSLLGEGGKLEVISGDELTEKYRVDPALRAANKFLVRKPENEEAKYIQAYNTGSKWVVTGDGV
jgi:hypothetical protein